MQNYKLFCDEVDINWKRKAKSPQFLPVCTAEKKLIRKKSKKHNNTKHY